MSATSRKLAKDEVLLNRRPGLYNYVVITKNKKINLKVAFNIVIID